MRYAGGRAVGLLIGFGLLAAATGTQARTPPMRLSANPSAVVAAEIAFNRLAQEKGQWTAFRETAAKDAVMFVPQMANAQAWLKGRKDPPASVKWQPEKVLMSCNGSIGVTTGPWQRAAPSSEQGRRDASSEVAATAGPRTSPSVRRRCSR